ncbi:hypothetical protein J3U21_01305 [Gilliamella sp. B2776]|uniref:lipase family alpha/beta hydrolase n=1 Tax=unclassified Gilliamella TaxID=2685620 RepID=UPI002269E0A1|nr:MULTISPECIES: hypothetical protein [unclassified Gilliamella]MCX8648971.1 hypothetical protein [Gilliamella sp. B2779]MCX8653153.1 hypothetical protein [Gilliamella sp. B2737]MCX8690783.1 hypothetical protein [Gilliamella sp. B2776]MCX8701941.1 hypothetical protein [Gilliamella sp. B2781]WDM17994.1 hypothetical protein J4T76_07775 [Gilliamella sp. B3022]
MDKNNDPQSAVFHTVPRSNKKMEKIHIEKERKVIPIIFLPGVMGSNLKVKSTNGKDSNTKKVWRLDSSASVAGWALWGVGGAKARKKELDPEKTEVDYRGTVIDAAEKEISNIKKQYIKDIAKYSKYQVNKIYDETVIRNQKIKQAINNHPENRLFGVRRARGWGSVGYKSYGKFLETFQSYLFQPNGQLSSKVKSLIKALPFELEKGSKAKLTFNNDQIQIFKNYDFPLYAMGYNWLESNEKSAKRLKILVEETIPRFYKKRGRTCDKVILITHSMGGLVARYYTEVLGGREKVYGVINGVQPSTGAAAAYTRMKRGSEAYGSSTMINWATANVLGKDAAEMTAVCAQAPGPLQLLPSEKYVSKWLIITAPNGKSYSFPQKNPYDDIYLNKYHWWCVCEPHLINPLNSKHDLATMRIDWQNYKKLIYRDVKPFHEKIANKYHPNTYVFFGIENNRNKMRKQFFTYQTVHWQGKVIKGYQKEEKRPAMNHIGANNRLDLNEITEIRTLKASFNDWKEVKRDYHFFWGTQTVSEKRGNIAEEYTLKKADSNGDGTVPQSSGEIPLNQIQARMHIPVEHEPAYQNAIGQEFALRAIVDIIQKVI